MPVTRFVDKVTALNNMGHVYPSGGSSRWRVCIEAGGPAIADAATVQDPESVVTSTTRLWIPRKGKGTHLMLCLGYSSACTPSTDPVVKAFGRTGTDFPMLLKNRTGGLSAALTTAPSTDATYSVTGLRYTTVDDSLHFFDSKECDEALVVIETAFAVSAGTTADSVILYKWV